MSKERETYESQFVTKYGAGCVAGVPIRKGYAYFRRPSQEEWDEMQELRENADGTTNRPAYYRMIHQCFIGCWKDGKKSAYDLADIAKDEGPAFIGTPCGDAVNKLAGTGDRQVRFLGEIG